MTAGLPSFAGKVALVAGATSGIGRATAVACDVSRDPDVGSP